MVNVITKSAFMCYIIVILICIFMYSLTIYAIFTNHHSYMWTHCFCFMFSLFFGESEREREIKCETPKWLIVSPFYFAFSFICLNLVFRVARCICSCSFVFCWCCFCFNRVYLQSLRFYTCSLYHLSLWFVFGWWKPGGRRRQNERRNAMWTSFYVQ